MEFSIKKVDHSTKDFGNMEYNRVKVSTIQQNPNVSTMANGSTENSLAKASAHGQMAIDIQDNAKMGCNTDTELIIGMKDKYIKGIGLVTPY